MQCLTNWLAVWQVIIVPALVLLFALYLVLRSRSRVIGYILAAFVAAYWTFTFYAISRIH